MLNCSSLYKMLIEKDKFKEWIEANYTNLNTRRQYLLAENRFMDYIEDDDLNQSTITKFLDFARSNGNPFYMGFIKAYIDCYDPDGRFSLKVPKDRSKKEDTKEKTYKFIEKDILDEKLAALKQKSLQAFVMARIYFETGLRAIELITLHIDKKWGWDLNNRFMWGIGKGNKVFEVHFSKKTAKLMEEWLHICQNPETPFLFYKSDGTEYKNSYNKLIRTYKKHCDFTPHQLRHALGHYLRVDKHWDLEQIRQKLRHSKIETTRIYTIATAEEIAKKEDEEVFDDE